MLKMPLNSNQSVSLYMPWIIFDNGHTDAGLAPLQLY